MLIDMWSFGCILVEFLIGYFLFFGEDEGDQFVCIIEFFGLFFQKLLENFKWDKMFINLKGYLRYCIVIIFLDGSIVLIGGCF